MRVSPAPDHDRLADALLGPSPHDAASSLAYWRERLERLPFRRVAARREARAMVIAWEDRLRRAQLERFGCGVLGRLAAGLAVVRGERPGAVLRRLLNALLPRRVLTGAVALAVAAMICLGVVLGVGIATLL